MVINCESCHAELEVPDSLADGQPVRCPYCHCRFIYVPRGREETGDGEAAGQSSAEQEKEKATILMKLHVDAQKILSGEKNLSDNDMVFIRDYVKEHGLDGIFKTPEEAYPKPVVMCESDDLLNGAVSLGNEDFAAHMKDVDNGCLDDSIVRELDAGHYVELNEQDFCSYFMQKLEKIKSIEELDSLIEKCLSLEPVYRNCPDETLTQNLSHLIGDLYFAMGRYDEAIERYTQIYEDGGLTGWTYEGAVDILNAYYRAKRQPPVLLLLHERGIGRTEDDLIEYFKRRISVECGKRGDAVFGWAVRPEKGYFGHGVFECMSYTQAEEVRKRLGLKPWLNFRVTKTFDNFSSDVYSEVELILKTQAEFKDTNFIVDKWCEKLDWFKAAITNLPGEEIVFGFHTPWTWKFGFDLYFPGRQLAIVLHLPSEYDASVFKYGVSGKDQYLKEWNRVVAKARRSHGIRIAYVPVGHDKSDIRELLDLCEAGSFDI